MSEVNESFQEKSLSVQCSYCGDPTVFGGDSLSHGLCEKECYKKYEKMSAAEREAVRQKVISLQLK